MTHAPITSLQSPHVERVKALLGSRGKKLRNLEHIFVADGLQSLRSALSPHVTFAPRIVRIYLTDAGLERVLKDFSLEQLAVHEYIMVSDQVMAAMAETESPQGIIAICKYVPADLAKFAPGAITKVAYFWQIQDPGNAGTAIRTADACGFDLVAFSESSVDVYSPKVIRSTAGSMWNIPVATDISIEALSEFAAERGLAIHAFDGGATSELQAISAHEPLVLVFGNEARGLPELPADFSLVKIPMRGHAESFNVASAAAIAMYFVSNGANS
jgi:TrmH family RNA methyltransferase